MRSFQLCGLICLVYLLPASAQQTIVVKNNKTDLATVFSAAKDSDRIIIRKGVYEIAATIDIDKTIEITGEKGVEIVGKNEPVFRISLDGSVKMDQLKIRYEDTEKGSENAAGVIGIEKAGKLWMENCELTGSVGVEVAGSCDTLVLNNNFIHHNSRCAVWADGMAYFSDAEIQAKEAFESVGMLKVSGNRMEANGLAKNALTKDEVWKKYSLHVEIAGFPAGKMPEKAKKAWLCGAEEEMVLFYELEDSKFLPGLTCSPAYINDAHGSALLKSADVRCNYQKDSIKLSCRWKENLFVKYGFKLHKGQLLCLEPSIYEDNPEIKAAIDKARRENDPAAWCAAYSQYRYYQKLDDRLLESLQWAYELADSLEQNKQGDEAAGIFMELAQQCPKTTEQSLANKDPEIFLQTWSKASRSYLDHKKYQACMANSKRLTRYFPDLPGAHLDLGDALFETGKEEEAKTSYRRYMKAMGPEGLNAPDRVRERLK